MATNSKHFGQHDANNFDPFGHLYPSHFLNCHNVRQIVHYPTQVIYSIGVGDKGVPRLPLAHLFCAAMVIANVGNSVD